MTPPSRDDQPLGWGLNPSSDPSPDAAPPPPATPALPDLSSWGKTAPAPAPLPQEHAFEPGDDIGNRLDGPDSGQRPRQGRGGRGGRDRRFSGGGGGGGERRFFGRGGQDRRPHIPGPPPPPTDLPGNPRVVPRQDHCISRKNIDANALTVLNRLHRAGYTAYLVGGGVRDLLLGGRPKDFDVATNAKPQEVKRVLPYCMIIGRRFKLCHVRFGPQVVEVATFRAKGEAIEMAPEKPDHGQTPLDENVFGTPEEDALRRDLTINGLFYDIGTFALIDYVGGLEDIQKKRIRTIGDPAERFREDPVRMVRSVRFAAKLGFEIEPATRAAMEACKGTLASANPSRMLEEWYRLLNRGSALKSLEFLQETGLLEQVLPSLSSEMAGASVKPWLAALDAFPEGFRPLSNALCLAAVFGSRVEALLAKGVEGDPGRAVWDLLDADLKKLQVSRRDRSILVRMVLSQGHFEGGLKPAPDDRFPTRDYFPAALDYFDLKSRAMGLDLSTLPDWRKAEAEVPRRPMGRFLEGPGEGSQGGGGGGPEGEGMGGRRRRRRGGRRRAEGGAPRQAAQGASARSSGHDLEQGPPPEVVEKLYANDSDDVPDWVSDDQPQ